MSGLALATLTLALLVALLVLVIVVVRALGDRRRRRDARLHPKVEATIAAYLVSGGEEPVERPRGRAERRLLRLAALEALDVLHGNERALVTQLLERTGIVADTARELLHRRGRTRRQAAEMLAEMRSASSVPTLAPALHEPDRDVRLACARALAEIGDPAYDQEVLDVADESADARSGAATAVLLTLGRRRPALLGDALAARRSVQLRRLAAAVCAELRLAQHQAALLRALGSEDEELVARAARALGAIGDFEAVPSLLGLLDDPGRSWFVRLAAADALGQIGDPASAEALARQLHSESWSLRAKAATALAQLGPEGREALERAATADAESVREQALVALEG